MADNPNVGPDPVEAKPNHVREKAYQPPNTPKRVMEEQKELPEATAEDKVRSDMPQAVEAVKKSL